MPSSLRTNGSEAFAARMGWNFKWVSAANTDFNYDYHVSFKPEDLAHGTAVYNYTRYEESMTDAPGFSVFFKDEADDLFHTYSTYARGLDPMNVAFQLLDLVPKGRDEAGLPHPPETELPVGPLYPSPRRRACTI